MPPLRLLIISGPYEGERLRKAALAVGFDVEICEPESNTAGRAELCLLTLGRVDSAPAATVARWRRLIAENVPLVVLGDAGMEGLANPARIPFFARPLPADALMATLAGRYAARTASAAPSARSQMAEDRLAQMAAGIDATLEAEMFESARELRNGNSLVDSPAAEFSGSGQATREVPLSFMATILGDERAPTASAVDMPSLLARAFHEAFTGRVRVMDASDAIEKAVYFESGRPVLATSKSPDDRMIEILRRRERISTQQYQEAVEVATKQGRRMGAVLVDLGFMRADDLLSAVREHYEAIVVSLFSWTTGSVTWQPGIVADPRRIRLLRHPIALTVEGLLSAFGEEQLAQRLGSLSNMLVRDAGAMAADLIAETTFGLEEKRAISLFDGRRSLGEIVALSGGASRAISAAVIGWSAFGVISPPALPGVRMPSAAPFMDEQLLLVRLDRLAPLAAQGDLIAFLCLDRADLIAADDATAVKMVSVACHKLRTELSPESVPPRLAAEQLESLEAIRDTADEAQRVLGSASLRVAYLHALAASSSREGSEDNADLPVARPGHETFEASPGS